MTRNIPTFLALHIYVQFVICPLHIVLAILTGRVNAFQLTKTVSDHMRIKYLRTAHSHPLHKNAMFLCNHRSWADFFIDQVLCNGATYLSRMLVIPACPGSSLYSFLSHSTWFFNRKKGLDRQALGRWIQEQWLLRPSRGVIVYPEGTRNLKTEPLRLKTGVLQMAYDYERPVQCVVTTNKEKVVNEREPSTARGVRCVCSVSRVLKPTDYKDFDSFVQAVRDLFHATWEDAYTCDEADAEPFSPPFGTEPAEFEPAPVPRRIWLARLLILLVALFLLWGGRGAEAT